MENKVARVWAVTRIALGWLFFWAFLDKTFGLGFATPSDKAWIAGGSPTAGFLGFAVRGPLAGFYNSLAGSVVVDWLFMLGLLGIGLALILGIGMRIATYSGVLLMLLMWSSMLPPENNPFMDDHLIYALVLIGLYKSKAGQTWGLSKWWAEKVASKAPILE